MRLHLRKQAAEAIEFTHSHGEFAGTDFYEQQILEAASEDESSIGLGRMTVIAAELLEQVRRSDPSYGLVPLRTVQPGPDLFATFIAGDEPSD